VTFTFKILISSDSSRSTSDHRSVI